MEGIHDDKALSFLAGGGEMGMLTRNFDWEKTALGKPESWPLSLRTTVGIVLHSAFPMFLFWGDDLISFYNDAFRPSLGAEGKHPAIGKKAKEIWPEIWDFIGPLIEKVMTTGEPVWFEDQLVPFYRNGKIEDIYWTFSYSPAYGDNGKVAGVFVTCTETTQKVLAFKRLKSSEQRLAENEANLRLIIPQVPIAMVVFKGPDHVIEIANSSMLRRWKKTAEEIEKRKFVDVFPEMKQERIPALLDQVYRTGEIYRETEAVSYIQDNSKETAYVDFEYSPLWEADGKISGVIATVTDVTERVLARKKLEESENRFRLLADSMPQHVWTSDAEGNLNYFNRSVYDYTGLTAEQMSQGGWLQIVHPDDREKNMEEWKQSIRTGKDFLLEHRFRKHTGEYRWQLSRAVPQYDNEGKIRMWVGSSTDIQDQKSFTSELEKLVKERTRELIESNESLKKSEERYHLMVEEVQDYAILYLNRGGIVENWNTGAEKIKGYRADEIIGKSFSVFYTEKDRNEKLPQKLLERAVLTGRAGQEGWRVKKDGTLFWASVVITAVHNEANEVIGFSKVTHDLTEKKAANDKLQQNAEDLQRKNEELSIMNRELESFAYISSHDLQEPLRKIQTFASRILQKDYEGLSETGRQHFSHIVASAGRMRELINDLLVYSRTKNAEGIFEDVDLAGLIEEMKADFREELQLKHGTIEASGKCHIKIIPFQFRQLLHNLISNALKFSSPQRPPYIRITSEKATGAALKNPDLEPQRIYCHIRISDNGIGFDQQYNEKIFGLFQRLHSKQQYQGTGIGLAIVKKIVENHHGFVTAKGETDKGATFDIYIPDELSESPKRDA